VSCVCVCDLFLFLQGMHIGRAAAWPAAVPPPFTLKLVEGPAQPSNAMNRKVVITLVAQIHSV